MAIVSGIPEKLGHYRIDEKIGEGGMGVVFRAFDERLEREVAVKVLPSGALTDETAHKRFRKEALLLSKLNHPNIATVHDFGSQDGVEFLVMELIEGATLTEKLGGRSMAEKEVVALGAQLAEGLSAAHEHGIVHRDLKPGNLRLSSDGRLKILDFGLAKLRGSAAALANTESLCETLHITGTLPYMAPEQILGGEVDARTDLYAAGLVLFEMATGKRAFDNASQYQMLGAILHDTPLPATKLNPRLSAELERIIGKCLEKDPNNRYQSAKELNVDLRRMETPSITAPFPSLRRRSAHLPILATVIVLFVVLTLLAYLRFHEKNAANYPQVRSIAILPFQNLSGDSKQDYLVDGIHEELTIAFSQITALTVKSRTSTLRYRDNSKTVPAIARELGVDALVEGSVRRSENALAVSVQLIDAVQDRPIWSKSYERQLTDVIPMQNEIALEVAREINVALTPSEQSRLQSAQLIDAQAYELYRQARYYSAQLTVDSVPKALSRFEQSLAKAPRFAAAYAGLADLYLSSPGRQVPGLNDQRALQLAEGAARKAIDLDPVSAEAHTALAAVNSARFRPYTAERELRRALEINPNSVDAHLAFAFNAARLGRAQDAIMHAQRALELDPAFPLTSFKVAIVYHYLGQEERSLQQLQMLLKQTPNFPMAYYGMAMIRIWLGRYDQVNCDDPNIERAGRNPERLAFLTYCYAKVGRHQDAERVFRQLQTHPNFPQVYPRMLSLAYTALGDRDRAVKVLQDAWKARTPWIDEILLEPNDLDSDPRYQALLQAIRTQYQKDQT
ncbi:MAG TPA: protein kinase [Terriglobales bacterium]|nr:protein kinase [Terriglobales bacterium]